MPRGRSDELSELFAHATVELLWPRAVVEVRVACRENFRLRRVEPGW